MTITPAPYDANVVRENLAKAIEIRGLTLRETARRAEADNANLSKFLSGKIEALTLPVLARLAGALDTTVGALIGEEASPAAGGDGTVMLSLRQLIGSLDNPRRTYDEAAIADLAESIATRGILQNLVARPHLGDHAAPTHILDSDGKPKYQVYEIVAGHRRAKALNLLADDGRWDEDAANIPVRIIEASRDQARVLAIIENLQREDVAPLEEAEAFDWFRRERMMKAPAIAEMIGKPGPAGERHVQLRLNLLDKLDTAVKEALTAGRINLASARALTAAKPATQRKLLEKVEAGTLARAVDIDAEIRKADAPRTPKPEQMDIEGTAAPAGTPPPTFAEVPQTGDAAEAMALIAIYDAALREGDHERARAASGALDDMVFRVHGGHFGSAETREAIATACRADDGQVPLWGQPGEFEIQVEGCRILIEYEGFGGRGAGDAESFAARATDLRAPFISSTGYRSFLGAGRWPAPDLAEDVAAWAGRVIAGYIHGELKGRLVTIEPLEERTRTTSAGQPTPPPADQDPPAAPPSQRAGGSAPPSVPAGQHPQRIALGRVFPVFASMRDADGPFPGTVTYYDPQTGRSVEYARKG